MNGLTITEHRELGAALKEARRLLLEAAAMSRVYRGVSQELFGIADSLISPRAFLERKLIEAAGDEEWVRDCYFGELKEEVDG